MSDPERSLWRAVLSQAFEDAEMAPHSEDGASEPFACLEARQYLLAEDFEEAEDLKLVCELADIPRDRLILWARRRYRAKESVERRVECGGEAAAVPAAETLETPEKREACTPQNADTPQTPAPA